MTTVKRLDPTEKTQNETSAENRHPGRFFPHERRPKKKSQFESAYEIKRRKERVRKFAKKVSKGNSNREGGGERERR